MPVKKKFEDKAAPKPAPDSPKPWRQRRSAAERKADGSYKAEAHATKAGIGALAATPAAADFDPMVRTYWTLAMALAWAIWRDPEKVRSCWNDFRRECWVWRRYEHRIPPDGRIQSGWLLEREKPLSFHDVWMREAAMSDTQEKKATEARDSLWTKLETGELEADGVPHREKVRVKIKPFEWVDLSKVDYVDGKEEAVFFHDGDLRFEAVRVARKDVVTHWPAPPPTAKAANDCTAFLIEKFAASPNERKQTNSDLWNESKEKFPRLSKRSFDAARKAAINATGAHGWTRTGPPKNSIRCAK